MCFVFDNIILGLKPDNSAQSLECKLLESKHLILNTWFSFFSFLFFFFNGGGRDVTVPQKGGYLH